jgi:hypothetical protein
LGLVRGLNHKYVTIISDGASTKIIYSLENIIGLPSRFTEPSTIGSKKAMVVKVQSPILIAVKICR